MYIKIVLNLQADMWIFQILCCVYKIGVKKAIDEGLKVQNGCLTLCIWESNKQVLSQTVKTQMKCPMMRHFDRDYTVCQGKKELKTKMFVNIMPLDMYSGISQVYSIKPEGIIH